MDINVSRRAAIVTTVFSVRGNNAQSIKTLEDKVSIKILCWLNVLPFCLSYLKLNDSEFGSGDLNNYNIL